MISRTSPIAAVFALFATASLAGAAELHARTAAAVAAKAPIVLQLPTVTVTAKRLTAL